MDSLKQPGFSSAQKVYRTSPRRYLTLENFGAAFGVVVCSFFIVFFTILYKIEGLIVTLILIGPFDAFCVSWFLWITRVRLVISDEGIGFSTGGVHIFTPWDNIAGFGRRQESFRSYRGGGWTVEFSGLELLQPAPVYEARSFARLIPRFSYGRPTFFIPVSEVVVNWLDSEVAADIQRYAPQVAMKLPLFRGASSPHDVKKLRKKRDVEKLIAALTAPDDETRKSAARALGELKDALAIDPLIAALTAPDDETRKSAARALGEFKDARAIDPLIAALQDPVAGVRASAVDALGNIGDARAIDPLLQMLGTDLDHMTIAAIQRVLVQNEWDAQAVEYLLAFQQKLAYGDPRRSAIAFLLQLANSQGV